MSRDWEDYQRGEELKALGEVAQANLQAILDDHDCETLGRLARNAYKYTDCGAWLSVEVWHEDGNKLVHGDAVRDLATDAPITAIHVGSIVEGVEHGTEVHIIDLLDDAFEEPSMAAAAYNAALAAVEQEANDIWQDTHGCPTCAKHWGEDSEGNDGMTPIWPDCPDCDGDGAVF
jgi:hypothetical protein